MEKETWDTSRPTFCKMFTLIFDIKCKDSVFKILIKKEDNLWVEEKNCFPTSFHNRLLLTDPRTDPSSKDVFSNHLKTFISIFSISQYVIYVDQKNIEPWDYDQNFCVPTVYI